MASCIPLIALVLTLLAAVAVADRLGGGGGGGELLGGSFIFGDSLVDAGNNNFLMTLSKADVPPNGIDFVYSSGQPTGRFTNGRTIADIIGEQLGQPHYALPFLSPNATGRVILNGINYGSGGGGILNETGRIFIGRISMDAQIENFKVTRKQINELLGKSSAKRFLKKNSIFSVVVASNDFLNNYLLPVLSVPERITYMPSQFTDQLITGLRSQLTRLYELDARKFVVGNVGPLGCIPYQKAINGVGETECADLPNQMAQDYNAKLRDLLVQLNQELPGATFCHANVYDLVLELISNHKKYGFETASKACCGYLGQYQGIIPCRSISNLCQQRSKYVFWDPYHPSEAANLVIAKELVHGHTYISPINLYTLRHL